MAGRIILVVFLLSTVALFDIVLCSDSGSDSGSAAKIEPEYVRELETKAVTITCLAGDSALFIEVKKKGGLLLGVVYQDQWIKGVMTENMKAKGNSTNSFLSLTIRNPTVKDSGIYECGVLYEYYFEERVKTEVYVNLTVNSSGSEAKTQPEYVNDVLTKEVNITCLAGNSATLITMKRQDKNKTLATLSLERMKNNLVKAKNKKFEGNLDTGNSTENFLSLIITNPKFWDSGTYECDVQYTFAEQRNESDQVSVTMNVDKRNVKDLVKFLMESIYPLKSLTQSLKYKTAQQQIFIDNQKVEISALQKQLKEEKSMWRKFSSQQQHLSYKIKDQVESQAAKLEKIIKKLAPSAFLTSCDGRTSFYDATTSSCPGVKFNVGGHYNNLTGVYTAPIHGLYVFYFFRTSQYHGKPFIVKILVNGGAVAKMFTYPTDQQSQNSMSALCELQPGDAVEAYIEFVAAEQHVRWPMKPFPLTAFSGHLVYSL